MIDVEELKHLEEKATPGPWGVYADQPNVEIIRSDGERIADVDTWTGKGCLDADLIVFLRNHVKEIIQLFSTKESPKAMKPITQLNNSSLLDASVCNGSCPEHEGYTPMAIREELERRLNERDALREKVKRILIMACVPAAEYVPALADIIGECDSKL